MKNMRILLTIFLATTSALTVGNPQPIILEKKLLNLIDGSFINADRIEEIKRFQFKILNLLLGDLQPDGTRIGHYLFQGIPHTVQTLQEQEELLKKSTTPHSLLDKAKATELDELLEKGKIDFMHISDEFRNSARGSKTFTVQLIEESCQKRGRTNSILLTWAHTTLEQEHAVFKKEVTNFEKLDTFLADLFNFLTDLQNSCPKARNLYSKRVEKYKAIKKLLPQEIKKINSNIDSIQFLAYLKKNHLDALALDDVKPETIQLLLKAFAQAKNIAPTK